MEGRRKWSKVLAFCVTAVSLALPGCAMFGSRDKSFAGEGGVKLAEAKGALLAGDLKSAEGLLNEAVEDGDSAEAHYYLALIEFGRAQDADTDRALSEITRSLKAYPSAQGYLLRGALLEARDPDGALQSYRMGLDIAPASGPIRAMLLRNVAVLTAKQGEWEDAYAQFKAYMDVASADSKRLSDGDRAFWGLLLYRNNQQQEAVSVWQQIRDEQLRRRIEEAAGTGVVHAGYGG